MKAIQQFISEAVSEFGSGSAINESQVRSIFTKSLDTISFSMVY